MAIFLGGLGGGDATVGQCNARSMFTIQLQSVTAVWPVSNYTA